MRQAKAGNKPTKLTDGNGLYLLVNPSGSKLWRYKYRIAGKENLFAISEYLTVSLQDARAARDDARELVKKGLHPSHARQKVLSARINEGKATFRAVSDEWLKKEAEDLDRAALWRDSAHARSRCVPVHREPPDALYYGPRCACLDAPGRRTRLPFRCD
ncbi:integrase arm-type DNA-binding domain-containing protein [Burkholderia stabilis]|uniref:integrase arm-type DNA-binding domain-containing protein n=1 Tax=Burkholderia stabilis TaxID=95485 RepID=UPI003D3630BB